MKYNLPCKQELLPQHKYRQRIETTQRMKKWFCIRWVVSIRWEFLLLIGFFNFATSIAQESKLIRQTQEEADRKSKGCPYR